MLSTRLPIRISIGEWINRDNFIYVNPTANPCINHTVGSSGARISRMLAERIGVDIVDEPESSVMVPLVLVL